MYSIKETLDNMRLIREGFDSSSAAHHAVKSAPKGVGKKTYNPDGSATITTKSASDFKAGKNLSDQRGISSTTYADHHLKGMGLEHNKSESDLKNHKQKGTHKKGKFSVHVSGSNSKGHTIQVK